MDMTPIAESLTLAWHPHPILPAAGRVVEQRIVPPGASVRDVLIGFGIDTQQEIVISVNDRLLPVVEWDTLRPLPGDIVNVHAAVSGGDEDGSNPLAVVASIALALVAPQISLAILGEAAAVQVVGSVTLGTLVSGAISMAGNVLINAVFKPTGGGQMDRVAGHSAASPTYSLQGGSNALRPYEPLPIVMGVHRIFPDFGAKPFTELSGRDQYLYQIFNFGVSDITLSDFKIGPTAIANYNNVTFHWPDANGVMGAFPGNVDTSAGGELVKGAGWVERRTSSDTIRLAADVEGVVFWSDPKYGPVSCSAIIEVEYRAVGDISWQPMGGEGPRTYDTHYWSFGNQVRYLAPDSNIFFPVYIEYWQQLAYGGTSYAEHTEGESGVVNGVTGTWRWRPYAEILTNGDGSALTEPAPAQPWVAYTVAATTIYHGTSIDSQRLTFTRDVAAGQYDIRIRITSAKALDYEIQPTDTRGRYQYNFTQLRSYQADSAAYLGQTRLGMVIKASGQLNGVLQQLSALASAHCYRWESGAWVYGATSNPAWWYLDFARGRTNSAGTLLYGVGLADAQIDIDGIKLWAEFCDDEGLSFNAVIDRRQSCADVLTLIARVGLASTSWASGKLGVVWDVPNATPVMVFGMGNIARGSFGVEYLTENLADEVLVRYVDAGRDWQQQEVRCTVPGVTSPERTTTVDLLGCTNATQAGKFANVIAAQQYYRRRTITWETDFEGFLCQRGDVVILSHDLTQWGYSGRVVSVSGNDVTIDRAVPRTAVDYLIIRQPDGTQTTYTVAAGTGDSDVLTLTTTPTLQPSTLAMDHTWVYSPLATPGKRVKIINVAPVSESRLRVVATDEDEEFYAAWTGTWDQPDANTLLEDQAPNITRIEFSETLALLSVGVVGSRVSVSIVTDRSADLVIASWRIAGGPWTSVDVRGGVLSLDTTETGLLEVEARGFFGALGGAPSSASVVLVGKSAVPENVAGFSVAAIGGQAHLQWTPSEELDVQINGYLRLRFTPDTSTPSWSSAVDIGPYIAGRSSSVVVPLLSGAYLAKWFDSSGLESAAATAVITNAADVLGMPNVVATLDQHAAFAGSKTSVVVDSGTLILDSAGTIDDETDLIDDWPLLSSIGGIASTGTYLFASGVDLGTVQVSRVTAHQAVAGFDALDTVDDRDMVDEWQDVDGELVSDVSSTLYLRTTDDDPGAAPTWSDWEPVVVGDYSARAFEFKAVLTTASVTHNIAVSEMSVSVDMPDRIEVGDDIASGTSTYTVSFAKDFMIAPALGISAQDMATGDYYAIANKSAGGFDITFRNAAGTAVSRTFDYIAKGY